jgi:hypothetical protein
MLPDGNENVTAFNFSVPISTLTPPSAAALDAGHGRVIVMPAAITASP